MCDCRVDNMRKNLLSASLGAIVGMIIVTGISNCAIFNEQQKTNELLQEIIEGGQHVR